MIAEFHLSTILALAAMGAAGIILGLGAEHFARHYVQSEAGSGRRPSTGSPGRWSIARMMVAGMLYGVVSAFIGAKFGFSLEALELVLFFAILIFLSFVDAEIRRIPNACIGAAVFIRVLYLVFAYVNGLVDAASVGYFALSALGIGVALLVATLAADWLFGEESLGGGDVKLFAVAALYFGWQHTLYIIFFSCILALLGWIVARKREPEGRRGSNGPDGSEPPGNTVPFGPCISMAIVGLMILS